MTTPPSPSSADELMRRARAGELTPGQHAPNGGDGYVRGGWDDVISAFLDGLISDTEYEQIRTARTTSTP